MLLFSGAACTVLYTTNEMKHKLTYLVYLLNAWKRIFS